MALRSTHQQNTHPFLALFPGHQQRVLSAWFGYVLSQQPQTPQGVLDVLTRMVSYKRETAVSTSTRALCEGVLLTLAWHSKEAWEYAQTLLTQREEITRCLNRSTGPMP